MYTKYCQHWDSLSFPFPRLVVQPMLNNPVCPGQDFHILISTLQTYVTAYIVIIFLLLTA